MQLETRQQPKPLPTNRAWFTDNTELYTNEGWVNITEITKRGLSVMTLNDKGRITPKEILSFATMPYNADIQYFEYADIYMEFRYAFPLQKSFFLPSFESKEDNIYGRKKYKGILYNITVPNNTVFVRHPKVEHRGKSILAQTAIVLEERDVLDDDYNHTEVEIEQEKEPEIDLATGLPIYRIHGVEQEEKKKNPKKKKGDKSQDKKTRRYRSLSHPNYYLCRVSW